LTGPVLAGTLIQVGFREHPCLVVNKASSLVCLAWLTLSAAAVSGARLDKNFAGLPLSFEANQGQTDPQVDFVARGKEYTLFLMPNTAVLNLRAGGGAVVRMDLAGSSRFPDISGVGRLTGKSNYFIGSDPKKWRTGVPNYAKVQYRNAYPGVDVIYYGNQQQLEYDFVVSPGADPRMITLELGVDARRKTHLKIAGNGDLMVPTPGGEVRFHKPIVYQDDESGRHAIKGRWSLRGAHRAGFEIAAYDAKKPLVIDPVLSYSTYLGGSGNDDAQGVAVDSAGNTYVTGGAASLDFPTVHPFQPTNHGKTDTFVTKLDPTGSTLISSTYLGGSGFDSPFGMTVDSAGNAYVAGSTGSSDFPTTPGAFQRTCGGGCLQGVTDLFVTKLNASGSALVYSTYLGGTGTERFLQGIAVDNVGHTYVTGWTTSRDFPTTTGAFETHLRGSVAAFVTEFDPSGSTLVYSTYLSGSGSDYGAGLALDSSGNAYVSATRDQLISRSRRPHSKKRPAADSTRS
jgi:hypothetical protein